MSAPSISTVKKTGLRILIIFHLTRLCHSTRTTNQAFHGTKTKYYSVVDGVFLKTLEEQPALRPPTCDVLQVNLLFRHGYRYPSLKDMRHFKNFHSSIKGKISAPKFQLLNDWSSPFEDSLEKHLAALGVIEIQDIAARFQKMLLKLPTAFSSSDIKLISSDRQRTIATARACLSGLLGEANATAKAETFKIHIDDKLLRFYDYCPTYLDAIKNNRTALAEMHKFKDGPVMLEMAKIISSRLGLSTVLEPGELKLISILAAYEEAIYGSSPWQGILTEDELDAIEYGTDLKSYWRKAYGYKLNYAQSCPLIRDIIKYMEDAVTKDLRREKTLRGVFRFGHAETLFPLIATMGLFKPPFPLTADNYHKVRGRKFRAGVIAPMSANVAVVLYKCDPEMTIMHDVLEWPKEFDRYMVQVLVNEQVMKLPFCKHTLCPYDVFHKYFQDYRDNCKFTEMCNVHEDKDEL